MSEKLPLVLMSGGLDSTYLTYLLLKTSPVDVLYVRSNQGEEKIRMELQAVQRIMDSLNTEPTVHHRVRSRYTETVMDVHSDRFVFQQILPWMIGALKTVDLQIHSKVCFGYVLGDQAIGWKTEILTAWDNLCEVLLGDRIPLEFPLIRNIKEHLIRGLPFDIRQKIWVCELPKYSDPREESGAELAQSQQATEGVESIRPDYDPANYFPCGACPACKRHRFVMENVGFDYRTMMDTSVEELRKIREVFVEGAASPGKLIDPPLVSVVQDIGVYPKSEDGMKVSSQ